MVGGGRVGPGGGEGKRVVGTGEVKVELSMASRCSEDLGLSKEHSP